MFLKPALPLLYSYLANSDKGESLFMNPGNRGESPITPKRQKRHKKNQLRKDKQTAVYANPGSPEATEIVCL